MKICRCITINLLLVAILTTLTANIAFGQATSSVRQSEIEQIRNLTLLQQANMDTLKAYVLGEFESMFDVRDPSDKTQALLSVSQSNSRQDNVKQMYSDTFTNAVLEATVKVQEQSLSMGEDNIYLQTIIVIAGTDNKLAIPALLAQIKSDKPEVRYWAISGFGKPELAKYFQSPEGANDYSKVIAALDEIVANETSANVIGKIADVAVLTTDAGAKLFDKCVSKRVEQYQAWKNVGNEMIDYYMFLNAIQTVRANQNGGDNNTNSQLMHTACKIYWMAWQRYYLGNSLKKEGSDEEFSIFANSPSMSNLLTILIEGEKQLMQISGEQPDPRMNNSNLMNNRWEVLERRVDKLVGWSGMVAKKFEIYGEQTEADLPKFNAPPAEYLENAENLVKVQNNLLRASY